MKKEYPVGVAQAKVLKALGLQAAGFESAKALFAEIGIAVSSKRGEPEIYILDDCISSVTEYGEGEGDEVRMAFKSVDFSPVMQWIVNPERLAARRLAGEK